MDFLKNERAWKRWAKEINFGQPQSPIEPPAKYPCFGYPVVQSFGYEEFQAAYLYRCDVEKMFAKFRKLEATA